MFPRELAPLGRLLSEDVRTMLGAIPVELDLDLPEFPNATAIYHVAHHGGDDEDDANPAHTRWVMQHFPEWQRACGHIIDAIDAHVTDANRALALGTARVVHARSEHVPLKSLDITNTTLEIGRVAAEDGSIGVFAENAAERVDHRWPLLQCSVVGTDALRPVALPGQLALFAPRQVAVGDGDLAMMAWNDEVHLRRVFGVDTQGGDRVWVGQSVSPHRRDCPPIICPCERVHLQKLVGVLFQGSGEGRGVPLVTGEELLPVPQPLPDVLKRLHAGRLAMIEIRSASAEPVALRGQLVLVREPVAQVSELHADALYSLRLSDGRCMLKRVCFPEGVATRAILQAINPDPGFAPIEVSLEDVGTKHDLPRIEEARQVVGVLFSAPEAFGG